MCIRDRYVSLAVYYLLLCVMRFLAVAYAGRVYQVKVPWRKRNPEKEDSLETVSYTHLDVYKRQVVLIELAGLKGRERISKYRLESAICYEGK